MSLTLIDRQILSWIEATYHKSHDFPPTKLILENWPRTFPTPTHITAWLELPHIKQALSNRGLSPTTTSSSNSQMHSLSEQQTAAILTVANLSDRRALSSKLKSIGVTLTQWNAWKKQPSFKQFLYSQLNDDFESSLDRVLSGLLSAVDKGDPRAAQLYLEMTGRQPTENERNYRLAISRIVDSIQRHCDPATLERIKEDFLLIEQGRDPIVTGGQIAGSAAPPPRSAIPSTAVGSKIANAI